jgi:fructosamine-3-kinase
MAISTPNSVAEISASWVEEKLRASGAISDAHITAIKLRPIGAGVGFLSSVAVVELTYGSPGPGAPASVVVKLEPAAGAFRDAERKSNAFEREVRFYCDVSAHAGARVPRCYYAHSSPEASVLMLEDLSHLRCGDQVRGMRHGEVLGAVRQIGRLHAAYWNNERLAALDWLPDHDQFWREGYEENWPGFAREYEVRVGSEGLAIGERVLRHLDWLKQRIAERPSVLIHSDLRADNLLMGSPETHDDSVILDWQLVTKSMAAIDPTRLFGGSEPASQREGHHLEVFAAWHEKLLSAGVSDYEFDDGLTDFRLGALYNLLVPVKAFGFSPDFTEARAFRLLDAVTERIFVSAMELNAQSLLPSD